MEDQRGPGKPVKHRPALADQHSQVRPMGKWRIGCFILRYNALIGQTRLAGPVLSATLEGEGA